jgi:hypothetical protein
MERKCKLVRQHQPGSTSRPYIGTPSAGPVFHPAQPQFQSRLQTAGQGFSTRGVKRFNAQTISRPLLLEIRMFRGPKLLETQCRLNGSSMLVERKVILPIGAPIHARALIIPLQLHLPLPVEPTLFLLLLGRTMLMGESTMLPWRKSKKLLMLSLICFSSTPLLQLCYLILEHHILSYLLHMLRSIICP